MTFRLIFGLLATAALLSGCSDGTDDTVQSGGGDYATLKQLERSIAVTQANLSAMKSRAEGGDAAAQFDLGEFYSNGTGGVAQNDAEALRWYRLAADQGNAEAQLNVGSMYFSGTGGAAQNDVEAVRWFRLAAAQGNAEAQSELGLMYANGRGVTQNDAEAARWFRLSADQGNAEAQTTLGFMYANGRGVDQNDAQAARLFRLAATQGDAKAQFAFGYLHANGRGVPQNDAEAARWYRLAAGQGLAEARDRLIAMGERPEHNVGSTQYIDVRPGAASPAADAAAAPAASAAMRNETAATRPSFDCARASTTTEIMICSSESLAQMDVQMSRAYQSARAAGKPLPADALRRDQLAWLRGHSRCSDVPCLEKRYRDRISYLENY